MCKYGGVAQIALLPQGIVYPHRKMGQKIAYGMWAGTLYWKLNGEGFPIEFQEARGLYDKYCKEFKTGVDFLRNAGRTAAREGFLANMNGRRRNWILPDADDSAKFPQGSQDREYRGRLSGIGREGGNFLIQSVNADITKSAMTNIRKHIKKNKVRSCVVLQVYDEIVTHTHKDDSPQFSIDKHRIMVESAERWINSVPVEVDGHIMPYWTK